MSHEIRTPLHAIQSMGRMLLDSRQARNQDNTREQQDLHLIVKSAENLETLVNDILFISKMQTTSFELHASNFDVCELIEDVVASAMTRIPKKQVEIFSLMTLPEFTYEVALHRWRYFRCISSFRPISWHC
jgi:signal transduction histidine kinase